MPQNLELKVKWWPIGKLILYANNSRDHSPEQIAQIAESIKEFGFVHPVSVDADGVLIAGHGRVAAAQLLQMSKVPVIRLGHLDETQARALRIADNAIALNATWNANLKIEVQALIKLDFEIKKLGLGEIQIIEFTSGLPPNGAAPGAGEAAAAANKSLAERFGAVPFSVFNSREGIWQERKRAWVARGIQSELGRGEAADGGLGLIGYSESPLVQERFGKKGRRKADAIPGGAGKNAAWRKGGRKPSGETNDLRGGLTHRVKNDAYRQPKRKPAATAGGRPLIIQTGPAATAAGGRSQGGDDGKEA